MKIQYEIPKIAEDYITSLRNEGYSERTIKAYNHDLYLFFNFINKQNAILENIKNITKNEIEDFLNSSKSFTTANRRLNSISGLYKYILDIDNMESFVPPTIKIKSRKIQQKLPKYLNIEELNSYLEECKINKRDYAINLLFAHNGLRLSELAGLNRYDLSNRKIKILRKGNKEAILPLNDKTHGAIISYLITRDDDNEAMFVSSRKLRLSISSLQKMVDKYAKLSKINKKISPHCLRHSMSTIMYGKTKDIRKLQELLGHKSINTTQIYTHVTDNEKKDCIDLMEEIG
jgi:integrase/recombinase XerD